MWTQLETGVVIQNWITPTFAIPAKAYMWTWGVGESAQMEPDFWHFHLLFEANDTAIIRLLWNLNQSVLFQKNAAHVDETLDLSLPRTAEVWRWDWLIENPHTTGLRVDNFTVTHYPFSYPERRNGTIAIGAGIFMIAAASLLVVYLKGHNTQRKRRRQSR